MNAQPSERQRSRRTRGVIAGLAGACLLLSGTFALWSASDNQPGGTISNGNLDVASVGDPTYWDVSADRSVDMTETTPVTGLAAHSVADITNYHIVPGDAIEANYGFSVALEGDNLVADIQASVEATTAPPEGVTFTVQMWVYQGGSWVASGSAQPLDLELGTTADLGRVQAAAELNGADTADIPVITDTVTSSTANVTMVVTGHFASTTLGQTSVQLASTLGQVQIDVTQVRVP